MLVTGGDQTKLVDIDKMQNIIILQFTCPVWHKVIATCRINPLASCDEYL
jgi:hypothetical protein